MYLYIKEVISFFYVLDKDSCWFAHIKIVSGQLLYIAHLHPDQFRSAVDEVTTTVGQPALNRLVIQYTWLDLRNESVRKPGYAKSTGRKLRPPTNISECTETSKLDRKSIDGDCVAEVDGVSGVQYDQAYSTLEKLVREQGWTPLKDDFLKGSPTALVDFIKPGEIA